MARKKNTLSKKSAEIAVLIEMENNRKYYIDAHFQQRKSVWIVRFYRQDYPFEEDSKIDTVLEKVDRKTNEERDASVQDMVAGICQTGPWKTIIMQRQSPFSEDLTCQMKVTPTNEPMYPKFVTESYVVKNYRPIGVTIGDVAFLLGKETYDSVKDLFVAMEEDVQSTAYGNVPTG